MRPGYTSAKVSVDIKYVVKNGRIYNADTLAEVWPEEGEAPNPQWRNMGPGGVRAGIR